MTLAQFRARYTQFSTIGDTLVGEYLTEALLFVGDAWGDYAAMGIGLYAAHMCALETAERSGGVGGLAAGDAVSKSVGSVSISRASGMLQAAQTDPFLKTGYGQRFAHLRDILGKGMITSGGKILDDDGTGIADADAIVFPEGWLPTERPL